MTSREPRLIVARRIFTGRRFVESILIEDGRVVAAGSWRSVRRSRPTGAVRLDAGDRLVLPGLIDAHVHVLDSVLAERGVALAGSRSLNEVSVRARRWTVAHPRGVVFGRGWDQELLQEHRFPTRDDLDRIDSGRPVILERVCGHVTVVNTAALVTAGLNEPVRPRPGERFGRDSRRQLNGILYEEAQRRVRPLLAHAVGSRPEWIRRFLVRAASRGLTTLGAMNSGREEVEAVAELGRSRKLPVRVRLYLNQSLFGSRARLPEPPRNARWRVVGVKLFLDGSLGARTAALLRPYSDAPDERGFLTLSRPVLEARLREVAGRDLQAAVHAIGDRAVSEAFRAFRSVPTPHLARIEHASVVPREILLSRGRTRIALVVQPGFVVTDPWIPERLGSRRSRDTYPFRRLEERGHLLAGSSDAPAAPLDPWMGIRAATERAPESQFGRMSAAERLPPWKAVAMYTSRAGQALEEPTLGGLEPGNVADFVILNHPSIAGALRAPIHPVAQTYSGARLVAEIR